MRGKLEKMRGKRGDEEEKRVIGEGEKEEKGKS